MSKRAYHEVTRKAAVAPEGCPVDHDFSPYSPVYISDPYAVLNSKRENEPVFYSSELGYVVATRMEDVEAIFRNPDVYSSENVQDPVFPLCDEAAEILSAEDYDPVAVMSNLQRPDHTRIRRYTQAGFSPRRMQVLEPIIRSRAEELIGELIKGGSPVEWVASVGNPLTAETILSLIHI